MVARATLGGRERRTATAGRRRALTPSTLRRLHLEWLACVLAALGFATVLQRTGALERIDLGLYDTVLRIGARAASDEVLIVAIDASSLANFGRWPWPRARHAELLERLAEARPRAVALDLMFVEPDTDPAADVRLAQAMARLREHTAVWLPVTAVTPLVEGRLAQALRPVPLLAQAASGLGHIHVELDADAVARSLYLREGTAAQMWPSLAGRLAGLPHGDGMPGADSAVAGWLRQSRQLIPFSGPAGHYRSVPYAALVRGEVAPQFLRDKLVLVGITATGVGDHYPTPFSAAQGLVPGVEINAAALDGLLGGRMITPLQALTSSVLGAALVLAWMTLLWRLGPRAGLAGLAAAMALGLAVSLVLQTALQSWWPPASCLAAMLAGYMLWSWRRLAVLFADLHRRAAQLGGAPGATEQDGWQQVVVALDAALEARRQRNDTLQLLSHDLRAPQSAILALLHSDAL
ncbi:MAG: CHASE2 domain-containing protein, partial [Comamonadaceae bacterium]